MKTSERHKIHLIKRINNDSRFACGVFQYSFIKDGSNVLKEVSCSNCRRTNEWEFREKQEEMERYIPYGGIVIRFMPNSGNYKIYENVLGLYIGVVTLNEGPGWIFSASKNRLWFDSWEMRWLAELLEDLNSTLKDYS